jgi:hypothetical protein
MLLFSAWISRWMMMKLVLTNGSRVCVLMGVVIRRLLFRFFGLSFSLSSVHNRVSCDKGEEIDRIVSIKLCIVVAMNRPGWVLCLSLVLPHFILCRKNVYGVDFAYFRSEMCQNVFCSCRTHWSLSPYSP